MTHSDGRHEFMFIREGGDRRDPVADPVEAVIAVRDYLDDLPETAGVFRLKFVAEESSVDEMNSSWFRPEHLWLCGSWRIPEFYPSGDNMGEKWVNPGYVHRGRYSDTSVQCECGSVMKKIPGNGGGGRFFDGEGHTDECRVEYRAEAIGEIYRRRRKVLRRHALLGHSMSMLSDRLHTGVNDVGHISQALDMNYEDLKDRGYEKRRNTMASLIADGHPTVDVGRVYDVSASTVRQVVATQTPWDISELRELGEVPS